MIDIQELIEEKLKLDQKAFVAISALRNKEIDIDERWIAFIGLCNSNLFIREKAYGNGYLDTLNTGATLFDDFYMERGESISYVDFYERILEKIDGEWDDVTDDDLNEWKERVLQSGYSSFCYDW